MKTEYSAGGIVYKQDNGIQMLLILDSYGKWAFPKGHIESGENIMNTALREVSEETGISIRDLKIVKNLGKTDFWFTLNNEKIHKYMHLYLMEAKKDVMLVPQAEEKINKAKWVSIDKISEEFGYENGKKLLKKAIKHLKIRYGI